AAGWAEGRRARQAGRLASGDVPAPGPRTEVPQGIFVSGRRYERPAVRTEAHIGAPLDVDLAGQSPAAGVPDLDPGSLPGARGHPTSIGAEVQPLQVRVPGEGHRRVASP